MATFDMLNVAIGMIFIYLLLSLIATSINELFEAFMKNRASDLKRGLQELIAPAKGKDDKLLKSFYEHPLICSLYKGSYDSNKNLPSYIPASGFSKVVINLLISSHKTEEKPKVSEERVINMSNLKDAAEKWPYAHSRKAILTLLQDADNDLDKFKLSLEEFFNNSMERVTGWYKKRVQFILLFIGFALAFVFNADSIALFKSLVKDAPLRNSLVTASQEFARNADSTQTGTATERFNENLSRVNNLRLPLGWDWRVKNNDISASNYSLAIPTDEGKGLFWNWVAKIWGLLLTGVAISLGSGFWFDMLNKVTIIRSSLKPGEKKNPEENKK